MCGRCKGMDYELYGHSIGIYRSGEKRAGRLGRGGKRKGRKRGESVKTPR